MCRCNEGSYNFFEALRQSHKAAEVHLAKTTLSEIKGSALIEWFVIAQSDQIRVHPDGDCFFQATAVLLKDANPDITANDLRQIVSQHMLNEQSEYEPFL